MQSQTHSSLEANSRAVIRRRPTFCLALTGNSSLGVEEGSLEKLGGEKISLSMGMGPKENTAQTSDVETPCIHMQSQIHTYKPTHIQGNTDRERMR